MTREVVLEVARFEAGRAERVVVVARERELGAEHAEQVSGEDRAEGERRTVAVGAEAEDVHAPGDGVLDQRWHQGAGDAAPRAQDADASQVALDRGPAL